MAITNALCPPWVTAKDENISEPLVPVKAEAWPLLACSPDPCTAAGLRDATDVHPALVPV